MKKGDKKLILFAALGGLIGIVLILSLLVVTDSAWLYPIWKPEYVEVKQGDTILYDELSEPPYYFSDSIAPITKYKLERYMKKNDLAISSGEYSFDNTVRFEQLIKILDFEESRR